MNVTAGFSQPNNTLTMRLEDGVTVYNVGDGMMAVDQLDGDTKVRQRVVLSRESLEAMLAWGS
jgi:hypothetical protein